MYSKILRSLFVLALVFVLQGCLSGKKITQIIEQKIGSEVKEKRAVNTDILLLNTDTLPKQDAVVVVKKGKSFIIPAVFLWMWNKNIDCELNTMYFSSLFSEILIEKADEFKLEKHLGNKKIEISLVKVPSSFTYSNNGTIIYGLVFYTYNFSESIRVKEQEFVFAYRITQEGKEIKSDRYTYSFDTTYRDFTFRSEKFIEQYLDQMKRDFEKKSSDFIERIIEEL